MSSVFVRRSTIFLRFVFSGLAAGPLALACMVPAAEQWPFNG
jgi:hypothetical protein